MSLQSRLFGRVAKTAAGCWEFQGSRTAKGHGQIALGNGSRRLIGAHRAAWIVTYGEIPTGLVVRHKCDNPPCINPAHLELGTPRQNVQDAIDRGQLLATRARGMRHGNARLTDAQIAEIRRRHRPGIHPARGTGCSTTELARGFGITRQYVGQLVKGQWRAEPE